MDDKLRYATLFETGLFDVFNDLSKSILGDTTYRLYHFPRCDLREDSKSYKVKCDVPGMAKEDLQIDVDEELRLLTLKGQINEEKEESSEESYVRNERTSGSFERSFRLPSTAKMSEIDASLNHGVLKVNIGKMSAAEAKKNTRKIDIKM